MKGKNSLVLKRLFTFWIIVLFFVILIPTFQQVKGETIVEFGYNVWDRTADLWIDYIFTTVAQAPSSGVAKSIKVYIDPSYAGQKFKGALYQYIDETTNYAGVLLGETIEYSFNGSEGAGYFEALFTDTVFVHAGTKYYIAYWFETNSHAMYTYRKLPKVNTTAIKQTSYGGAFPSPLTGEAASSYSYPVTCTYVLNIGEPILSSPSPANASTNIQMSTQCSIRVDDLNSPTTTIRFYENSTGSWILRQTNSSAPNGTYNWIYSQANISLHKYYWKVSSNDGTYNTTGIYHFTTGLMGVNPIVEFTTPPSTQNGTHYNVGENYIRADLNSSCGNSSIIHNITKEVLRPTSCWNTYYIDYTGANGAAYKCIDDASPDGGEFPTASGSFIYTAIDKSVADSAKWDAMTSGFDASYTFDSLTYYITCGTYGGTTALPVDVYLDLNISGSWYESATYAGRISSDATWYTFSYTWTQNPATSAPWTIGALNNIHFGMRNHKNGAGIYGSLDTTQTYIQLNGIDAENAYTYLNLNDDVLAWLRFDDQTISGNPIDISGNNNNGTLNGGAFVDGYGIYGKNLWTDGYYDCVNIPTSSSMNAIDDSATFSIWARSYEDFTAFPSSNRGLFGCYQGTTNAFFVCIHTADQKIEMYNRMGSSYSYRSLCDTFLSTNFITSWHLYTITFNSSYVAAYVDGIYKGRAVFDSAWPDLSYLADGFETYVARGWTTGTFDWYGDTDEFIVFNRELSVDEIQSLYDSQIYQYDHNFTGLENQNYTFQGVVANSGSSENYTEVRWSNISIEYAPTISYLDPGNATDDIDLYTTCTITAQDLNNDTLTVTWRDNSSGAWTTRHVDTGVSAGSTLNYQYLIFNKLSTRYYWRVYINDGYYNISYTYYLNTKGDYFFISGYNGGIDWAGISGGSYWNNETGSQHETVNLTMRIGASSLVSDVGVWIGDLSIVYLDSLTTGLNIVNFPSWSLDTLPYTDPESVFDSVKIHLINITEISTGKYWNRNGTPTLTEILPGINYNVYVNQSCTLRILTDYMVNASNISMVVSSDNTTWGSNTRSFSDYGSELKINGSIWSTANGFYGVSPFYIPLTNTNVSIYLRFKLNIPIYVPSNYTYCSLSSLNWKIYIYSGNTTEPTPVPFYSASLPSSGYFTLKWAITNLYVYTSAPPVSIDINGDGIQEIFLAGRNGSSTNYGNLVSVNGSTGALNWRQGFTSSYVDSQQPILVHDVDKDGEYEIVMSANTRTMCFNAQTGAVKWDVAIQSGWHYLCYLDTGTDVFIYVSFHDGTSPYDAKISKINGRNGSLVAQASVYYTCYGGTTIADLDNNGRYEILVTDAGQDFSSGKPARSVRCYDEDLNLLWAAEYPSCESQSATLIDVNGDGNLEVVIGKINKTPGQSFNNSGIYIYNYDGTIYRSQDSIPNWRMHVQPALGDVDGDGHIEMMDGYSGSFYNIFDLTDWMVEYTFQPAGVSEPPFIGNVIYDSHLLTDNVSEIISINYDGRVWINKYNTTTASYQALTYIATEPMEGYIQDVDHDGFNEMIFSYTSSNGAIKCYETFVPTSIPAPRTDTPFGGERRLKSDVYYPRPYSGPLGTVLDTLPLGGEASVPAIASSTFIVSCTSQHSIIELKGNYNLGNYTTYLNTTIYKPAGWTIDHFYLQLINNSIVYENITSGFITSIVNASHIKLSKLYNPSTSFNGIKEFDVDVHLSLIFNGIPFLSGNKTFNDAFKVYAIDSPYNGSSVYNTTTNALNLTWSPGNYTNRYVVVKKTGTTYPTSPTDGAVMQNSTSHYYNESSVLSSRAYSVFGYNTTTRSFSSALNIPWGAIRVDVHDENNATKRIRFNLLISNRDGSQTYTKTNIIGPYYLDLLEIPYGPQTIFILSNTTYRQRTYYKDLYANTFYNFSFYLPPITPGGGSTPEENNTQLYLFTVYNRYGQTLQDVTIDVRRYINTTDSYESVGILLTDAAGQADIFLIPYKLYKFVVSKSGFITTTSYWTPTPLIQTHTFILDYEITTEPETIDPYDVIDFTAGFPVNNVTLTVDVDDSTGNLTNATIYIYEGSILIYMINFSSTPFHLDYTNNATSPNNNRSEYIVVLYIHNHSEFPGDRNYNFTIIIQRSNPHGLLLNLDIDLTETLGDAGGGIGVHIGWINVFVCGLGVFVIVSFGKYWSGIGIAALGLVIGLIEFTFGLPGFTGIQLVSFIGYCIIMGVLVEIGKAKHGKVGF
jgi:hypothetical protein